MEASRLKAGDFVRAVDASSRAISIVETVSRCLYITSAKGSTKMRMIIANVEYENDCIYVTGRTSFGSIKGKWYYEEKPILGEMYFFELSIDELDRNEISIIYDEQFHSWVCLSNKRVQFTGICEEIDDIYVIRFTIDWFEMVSIENDDFTIKKGDVISFSLNYDCIGIYPY